MRHPEVRAFQVAVVAAALLLAREGSGAAHCEWVPATGEAVSEHVSAEEARNLAVRDALIRAVERVAGVRVQSGTLVRNAMFAGHFLWAFADGYVVDRKVVRWDTVPFQERPDRPPVIVYRVQLEACVLRQAASRDPAFRVEAALNSHNFVVNEKEKATAELTVRCTRACHVSIFGLADGKYSTVVASGRSLAAGEELRWPPRGHRPLEAFLIEGRVRDTEAFLVVASKRPFDPAATLGRDKDLTVDQILRVIGKVPADERVEELLVYEVRAR